MTDFFVSVEICIGVSLGSSVPVESLHKVAFLPRVGEIINFNSRSVQVLEVFHSHLSDEGQTVTLVVTTGQSVTDDALIRLVQDRAQ